MKRTDLYSKIEFVAFCIEQYKHTIQQDGYYIYNLFEKHGIISFLIDNYEILHTQSAQSIQHEIEQYIKNH